MPAKQRIEGPSLRISCRMVNNTSPKLPSRNSFVSLARNNTRIASNFIEFPNQIGIRPTLCSVPDQERDTMITRLLAAFFALYIVAGAPKPDDLPMATLFSAPDSSGTGKAAIAKQALDFCLDNRETCANIVSGLAVSPTRTGAIAESPKPAEAQSLPLPAPELPLPPRRRQQSSNKAILQ
jgi:hypothetical protein